MHYVSTVSVLSDRVTSEMFFFKSSESDINKGKRKCNHDIPENQNRQPSDSRVEIFSHNRDSNKRLSTWNSIGKKKSDQKAKHATYMKNYRAKNKKSPD